jgi:hypothetical protein
LPPPTADSLVFGVRPDEFKVLAFKSAIIGFGMFGAFINTAIIPWHNVDFNRTFKKSAATQHGLSAGRLDSSSPVQHG